MQRRGFLGALAAFVAAPAAFVQQKKYDRINTYLMASDPDYFRALNQGRVDIISERYMRIPLELRPSGNYGHFNPEGGSLGRGPGPTYTYAIYDRRTGKRIK